MVIDLLVLKKLLESKEELSPTPTANKVVYIDRPRRVVPAVVPVEDEEDLEELKERLKEELRIKFLERRKAWERDYLWNKEDNLQRFRVKNGIEPVNNGNKNNNLDSGLFSLATV